MDGDREQLEFFFHVTNADDYETLDLASTSHGDIEVAECAFVDPKTTDIKPDFLTTIDIDAAIASSNSTRIAYDGKPAVKNGVRAPGFSLAGLESILKQKAFTLSINLHQGRSSHAMLTCDCSEEYVKINGSYMT